jgi:hypothetical protein
MTELIHARVVDPAMAREVVGIITGIGREMIAPHLSSTKTPRK